MTRSRKFVAGGALLVLASVAAGLLLVNRRPTTNILLVTFDTTRADRIGCYGYAEAATPVLDRLAGEGVVFKKAYTAVPLTLPSHATILTGLYPPEHGLRTNGRNALADKVPTLATLLAEQGYRTGAFIAAFVLDSKFGLARGFEHYDDDVGDSVRTRDVLHRSRSGDRVADAALAWLKERNDEPFFCWVHFYDPHHPYEEHREKYGDTFEGRPYDAEIAFTDEQLGRLIDYIDAQGLSERTMIVVAGDHGEGLGDHGEQTHTYMVYDSTMRVPLVCRQPGRIESGATVTGAVSLVDVRPTILEWAGAPIPDAISGRSLAACLLGKNSELEPRPCYGESQAPLVDYGWSPLECVITDEWKYIRTARPELYRLADDPGEIHNLFDSAPEQQQAMDDELALLEADMTVGVAEAAALSSEETRALEHIGYVGSAPSATPLSGSRELPDIKDMMTYVDRLHEAQELMEQHDYAAAESILAAIAVEVPELESAHANLGICLAEQGHYEAAIDQYRKCLELNPKLDTSHLNLGLAQLHLGRFEDAAESLAAAVRLKPESGFARAQLAVALRESGAYQAAQDQAREALRWEPDLAEAHEFLGQFAMAQGNLPQALEHFQTALKTTTTPAMMLNQIGIVQAQLRNVEAATASFREALRHDPQLAQAHTNLAIALVEQGQTAEGVDEYEQALSLQPELLTALMNLAWLLATRPEDDIRNGVRAVELARHACEVTERRNPAALDALAAALAETGDYAAAAITMQEMLDLFGRQPAGVPPAHLQAAQSRLELYQQERPYRERNQ